MSYAIGIVTYQPDKQRLQENILSALTNQEAGHVFIVDNHSSNLFDIQQLVADYPRTVLVENDDNKGIAHALNQIAECAEKQGYEWFVTLDQDSVMPKRSMSHSTVRFAIIRLTSRPNGRGSRWRVPLA